MSLSFEVTEISSMKGVIVSARHLLRVAKRSVNRAAGTVDRFDDGKYRRIGADVAGAFGSDSEER